MPKTLLELLHNFSSYAQKQDVFGQQDKAIKVISGPISNAREKLQCVRTGEATKLLRELGYSHAMEAIQSSILEVFDEEVAKATNFLKEAQISINHLNSLLEEIENRIIAENNAQRESVSHEIEVRSEDCRDVAVHLQLRNKILKYYLLSPAHNKLNRDPFSQVPNFKDDKDHIIYLLCKIEASRG